MAKREERQKVIALRKRGLTYSEIREKVSVSKSSLSLWLNDLPLSKKQQLTIGKNVKKKRLLAIERTRATKRNKRDRRLERVYREQSQKLLPLNRRELYLCGLFLYWGEGVKSIRGGVSLNNTDPKVVKFYKLWMVRSLKIPKEKIKVILHLYRDMNVAGEINYWSKLLRLPKNQFVKPYIKKSTRDKVDHKGHGHGTCGLYVYNQYLKEEVILGIESIADYYFRKID